MTQLATASPAQQQAAFNKVYPELVALAEQYVPPFFNGMVMEKLNDPATKQKIMKIIDDALNAADNVPAQLPPATGGST